MRACRYCSHQNADHLGYCSQCGRRMGPLTGPVATVENHAGSSAARTSATLTVPAAMSRTVLAQHPAGGRIPGAATGGGGFQNGAGVLAGGGRAGGDFNTGSRGAGSKGDGGGEADGGRPPSTSGIRWVAGSIGYIYVYLRGKLDAGERRKRLSEERDGAERLLGGAIKELGLTILEQGIQHPDLTGLLEAIGRAQARREAAEADIAASEKLQAAEEARLGAQEAVLDAAWNAADQGSREAEEATRAVSAESQAAATRLGRVRDERTRLERDAEAAEANVAQRAAHLRHEAAARKSEETALEEQVARLDAELDQMRPHSAALRAEAQAARVKLEESIATRRSAGSAMKASIAGHSRDRADADQQVSDLTAQLGRAAAQARSVVPILMPAYQRIDRLQDTLAERASQIAAIDRSLEHYDSRKLLTGVSLITSMIALAAAALWVVLK
jgi:hypothetical protein